MIESLTGNTVLKTIKKRDVKEEVDRGWCRLKSLFRSSCDKKDDRPPTIQCYPAPTSVAANEGECDAVVSWKEATATDDNDNPSVSQSTPAKSYGAEKRLKRAQLQLVRDSKESRVESVDEPAVSTTSSATTPTMPTRMVVGESNWPSASQDENVCN
ncbi:hypothetical protein LSAT2_029211 [Lamellibrachia satsuma]|nr:hypothetical protein LSAT2_029211 [Lamellibrachia satsuma]